MAIPLYSDIFRSFFAPGESFASKGGSDFFFEYLRAEGRRKGLGHCMVDWRERGGFNFPPHFPSRANKNVKKEGRKLHNTREERPRSGILQDRLFYFIFYFLHKESGDAYLVPLFSEW